MRKIFANLKSVVGAIAMVSLLSTAALTVSCTDYDQDIKDLQTQIDNLEDRVTTLENNFEALSGALNGIVLDAEQDANGNWVVTTENGKINITVEGDFDHVLADGGVTVIEENGEYYWAVVENGVATALLVDGEKVSVAVTPEVRVNPATQQTEFTVDGENWYAIGYVFEGVAVEENELVLTLAGGQVVRVPMAEEASFEVASGKLYFQPEETKSATLRASGVTEMFVVDTPKGWEASVSGKTLTVTAPAANPNYDPYDYWSTEEPVLGQAEGYVKVMATTEGGKALVGKLSVQAGSEDTGSVVAYGGKAYYTINSSYYTYFYNVCEKSQFEAVKAEVLKYINNNNYNALLEIANEGMPGEIEVNIADLLGSEPEVGKEYVVWGLIDNYGNPYEDSDFFYTYYAPVNVEIKATEVTAFDIQVEINVEGAEEYIVLAMPADYYSPIGDPYGATAENIVMFYQQGDIYGALKSENYKGSLLDVCANTMYSMSGQYAPNKTQYLLVMPIDGRPIDTYTVEDVVIFEQANAGTTVGGDITLEAVQVYQKEDYTGAMVDINRYKEVVLNVTPSEGWYALYCECMSDEDLALYADDAAIIDYLVTNTWAVFASDQTVPLSISNNELGAGQSTNFVMAALDAAGQYTQVYKVKASTDEVKYSETLTVTVSGEEYPTTTDVELTLTTTGTATQYRYLCLAEDNSTWMWTYGEDKEKAKTALVLNDFSQWSNPSVTIDASEVVDGKLMLTGLEFDKLHYFFLVGIDEAGAPSQVAEMEIFPLFDLGTVLPTTDASYEAVKPELEYVVSWEYGQYVNIDIYVKAVEGTTVAVFCDNPVDYMTGFASMTSDDILKQLYVNLSEYNVGRITSTGCTGYNWVLGDENQLTNEYSAFFGKEEYLGWFGKHHSYKRLGSQIVYAVQSPNGYYEPIVIDLTEEIEAILAANN